MITIRKPDDFHLHPRNGELLKLVLPYTSKVFGRAMVKGNFPGNAVVDSAEKMIAFRQEILANASHFNPVMSVMLTKNTTVKSLEEAHRAGASVLAWIPGKTSTNSDFGIPINELVFCRDIIKRAGQLGMIFSGHWERARDETGKEIPEPYQEICAIDDLDWLVYEFPGLKILVEHMSTKLMIDYVRRSPSNVKGSLTCHHAILTSVNLFDGEGNKNPDHYCKPVAKMPYDRQAVIEAMTSGNPKFFFGSDSAPHENKDLQNPAAGIFSAPVALPLLVQIFEEEDKLDQLENFVSRFGAEAYSLPLNEGTITLKKEPWVVPERVGNVKVFMGGETLQWQVI